MKYDFDTYVDRRNSGLGKYDQMPESLKEKNYPAFTGAEMDYKTAPCIMEALSARALGGIYGWTEMDDKYRDSVVWWMKNVRNWDISPKSIVSTFGTVHALSVALRTFTEPGDGVIIQPPVYTPFFRICSNNSRKPLLNTLIYKDGHYSMDFDQLEAFMSDPKTKLMFLCNPHNPITRVWTYDEIRTVARMAAKHGVIIVSDEIYGELSFNEHRCIPLASIEEAKDISLVCTSIGKSFNFVGTKHANVIIPNDKLREKYINQIIVESVSALTPFMYTAVRAAYTPEGIDWVREMKAYAYENIMAVHDFFEQKLPEVIVSDSQAGCLCWVDWRALKMNEDELTDWLINKCGVVCNMGSHYGEAGTGFTRIAVGTPHSGLQAALKRIENACKSSGFIK